MAYTTIDDPSAFFQVKTYSGNNTQTAITYDGNSNLQPDWIWAKSRSNAHYHDFRDTSRGLTKRLYSNDSDAEDTKSASYVSFNSNGFTLGDDGGGSPANTVNSGSNNYASWGWKANGGTTSSNTDGSITTTVQANTTAGFSIVTWTGTGSNATIGHGLGVVPQVIISKSRGHAENWAVYHQNSNSTPEDYYLPLDSTDGSVDSAVVWNDTAPTSSVISIGTQDKINKSSSTHIAYCFNEIKGYSKFGSYEGNGNANGTFVHLGFKPAWFMCKSIDTASSDQGWNIFDTKRDVISNHQLLANDNGAEVTTDRLDIVSNGVKMRNSGSQSNSAQTYIYMAFAENPFVSSKGVPTTAR